MYSKVILTSHMKKNSDDEDADIDDDTDSSMSLFNEKKSKLDKLRRLNFH